MKNKGLVIGIGSTLLLGVAVYFIVRASRKSKEAKGLKDKLKSGVPATEVSETNVVKETPLAPVGAPIETTPTQIKKTTAYNFTFPIGFGKKGENVRQLQTILLMIDKDSLPKYGADGMFGGETSSALIKQLGKATVDSQADIEKLYQKMKKNVGVKYAINSALSSLGLTVGF